MVIGGGGEIRTLGGLSPSLVFKTSAFNRSATPPRDRLFYTTGVFRGMLIVLQVPIALPLQRFLQRLSRVTSKAIDLSHSAGIIARGFSLLPARKAA